MANFPTFKSGLDKIRQNPQLTYTVLVAALITTGFVLMAQRFVSIANNAQERLINVRIGSIQDAFVSFAKDSLENTDYINERIRDVMANNATVRSFRIIEKQQASTTPETYAIIASNDNGEIGKAEADAAFLYNLAISDPEHSLTVEANEGGQRLFKTARAIISNDGKILGVVFTKQTLSEADLAIQENIAKSILILVIVLIAIMLLFLRHSKIIDYTTLYKRLKEVDELKDDFISMASHELRTPLTTIRGYAEFIREAPELEPNTKDFARKIDVSAKGLDELVADILDVSRIEQGRMSFKIEKFDPKETIESVASSLAIPAKDKGLDLSFESLGSSNILADKERLKQVLNNIVGNSIKYTVRGEIKIKESVVGNKLTIRVSDTGIGMSADDQKRLFEKFYRIKNKDTENVRGTGLGLWITEQIVKEMKGTISVESIQGVGSHFIISFPIIKQNER